MGKESVFESQQIVWYLHFHYFTENELQSWNNIHSSILPDGKKKKKLATFASTDVI